MNMNKVFSSPSQYVQGSGALKTLGEYVKPLGNKALVITTAGGAKRNKEVLEEAFSDKDLSYTVEVFGGESSQEEIDKIVELVKENGCNVIVSVGGGKTTDVAKAVAYFAKLPVIICPTIASCDAPCTKLSVIYTPEGVVDHYLFLPTNPDVVLVDTDIVAKSPARLTVSGMGDALATYFEGRATDRSYSRNLTNTFNTRGAMALAKACYDTLINEGFEALESAKAKVSSLAFEHVVEANTLLSGVGAESSGCAGAHAIHNGFTVLPECHAYYHGEKVAFGTLAQLVHEGAPRTEINEVLDFCISVGLPVTLAEIGVTEVTPEKIRAVAEKATAEGETIFNQPEHVTVDSVYAAILAADAIGKRRLEK